jgi:hypothetical protein
VRTALAQWLSVDCIGVAIEYLIARKIDWWQRFVHYA